LASVESMVEGKHARLKTRLNGGDWLLFVRGVEIVCSKSLKPAQLHREEQGETLFTAKSSKSAVNPNYD
jgi:hypothetical protein